MNEKIAMRARARTRRYRCLKCNRQAIRANACDRAWPDYCSMCGATVIEYLDPIWPCRALLEAIDDFKRWVDNNCPPMPEDVETLYPAKKVPPF